MIQPRLAVLVAAGDGQRLGRPEGKAMVPLAGRPLFLHSYLTLSGLEGMTAVAVVIRPCDADLAGEALLASTAAMTGYQRPQLLLTPGGPSRQASVLCGLRALAAAGYGSGPAVVLVHDAARALVSRAVIAAVAEAAGSAAWVVAPVIDVVDTVRSVEQDLGGSHDVVPRVPPRELLRLVQTPQAAGFADLLCAHEQAAATGQSYPDELTLAEACGMETHLIPGDRGNLKITEPQDLALAAAMLKAKSLPRTGIGFDVHPLVLGGPLRLGGVTIPFTHALAGHSDADVAVHALMDAILGAAGCGDIGGWFPPRDPRWRGADSLEMLEMMWRRLAATGLVLGNLDLVIAAEEPRLSPHFAAMRQALAEAVSSEPSQVNVKATTTERLGFVGRREGIAAMATVTVFAPAGWLPPDAGELSGRS